jgi:hypothetical protein
MYKARHLVIMGGLAWGLLIGMSSQARAQANGVAAVSIRNATPATVTYAFWWGDDGEASQVTLGPGEGWYHYYALDDDGLAPRPHVKFDDGSGAENQYVLEFNANYGFRRGNPYHFSYTGNGTLDLFNGPPPVFHRPPPVFYRPPPVFYRPPPVFYGPPPVFHPPLGFK